MEMKLCDMTIGERATVTGVHSQGSIRRRLQDIGIIEGTDVECLMKSPLGDPTAYLVKGAVIALRREQAEEIKVRMQA